MQKKYIIPVLMAVPTAMPMMAEIALPNMPTNTWQTDGVYGDKIVFNGNQVSSEIGLGEVSQILNLPTGQYTLKFASVTNVKVKINGAVVDLTNGEYTFKVNAGTAQTTEVTLAITGQDGAKAFSFEGAALELDFNFKAAEKFLTDEIGKLYPHINDLPNADNTSEAAKQLSKEGEEIKEAWGTLRTKVVNIEENASLDSYTENEFYKDVDGYTEDKIAKEIEALKTRQDNYIKALAVEDGLYQNYLANQAIAADFQTDLDALKAMPGKCETALGTDKESYAYGKYSGAVADYKAKVDAFVKEFDAAVANRDKVITDEEKTAFQTKITNLIKEGNDLIADINGAIADAIAYEAYQKELALLNKTYTEAINKIDILSGVEGMNNHFATDQAAARDEIEKLKADAIANCTIKTNEIDGADEKWNNNDKKVLEDAIKAINGVADELTATVTGQNEAYTDAMNTIGGEFGLQENLDELKTKAELLPEGQFKNDFNKKVNDLQTRVDALKDAVANGYANKDLDLNKIVLGDVTTTFEAESKSILDTIKDLDQQFEKGGYYDTVIYLNGALNDAWETIEEENKDADYQFIVGKFKNTRDNIANSIKALDPEKFAKGEYTEAELTALKDAIQDMVDNAAKLHEKVGEYLEGVKDAQYYITTLNDNIHSDDIININDNYKIDSFTGVKDIQDKLDKITSDYAAALDKNDQECYDAIAAVVEALQDIDFKAETIQAGNDFHEALTTNNEKQLATLWASIQKDINDGKICRDVDLQPLRDKIIEAREAFEAAKSATEHQGSLCQIADQKIDAAYKMAVNLVQSEADYHKYFATQMPELATRIAELRAHNEELSQEPAKAYYADDVIGAEASPKAGTLQARYNELLAKVDEAHKNSALTDKAEEGSDVTKLDQYKAELDAINTLSGYVYTAIVQNEVAHTTEINANKRVMGVVESVLETIKGYGKDFNGGMAEQINKIVEDELVPLNREVAQAYSEGLSFSSNPLVQSPVGDNLIKFDKGYDEIEAKILALSSQFSEEYGKSVIAHNNSFIGENSAWQVKVDELRNVYASSIGAYNAFLNLTNEGYKDFIASTLETHKDIYDYSTLTRNLEASVKDYVAEANANLEVIDATKFYLISTRRANNYIEEMDAKVEALSSAVNAKAEEYYSTKIEPAAAEAITNATATMRAAGIDEAIIAKALEGANKLYGDGHSLYVSTNKNLVAPYIIAADGTIKPITVTETIGYIMDAIANYLDEVEGSIDLQSAAMADWNSKYEAAVKEIAEKANTINSLNALTAEEKAPTLELLNSVISDVNTLNSTAVADTDLISSVLGYKTELSDLLATLDTAVDQLQQKNDAKVDEQQAIDKYANEVKMLNGMLEDFEAFINNLACESSEEVVAAKGSIESAIGAVQTLIKNNEGQLAQEASAIDAAIATAKTAVSDAYTTAADQEISVLTGLEGDVKVAFNNAKVSPNCPADIEQINSTLDFLFEEIAKLKFDGNNAIEFKGKALNFENLLNDWLVKLQGYDPDHGDTLQATLDELNAAADALAQDITDGKAGVNELVKDQFDSRYDELTAELEAIKGQFTALGNNVITQKDNLLADMKAIGDKLTELNAEAKEAGDKAEADKAQKDINDANFVHLTEIVTALNSQLEALKASVESYGYTEDEYYQRRLETIETSLANLTAEINTQNEAIGLNYATTENLQDQAVTIAGEMTSMSVNMATRYTNVAQYAAFQAIEAAQHALSLDSQDGKFVVPAVLAAATEELNSLFEEYTTASVDYSNWVDKWANREDANAADLDPLAEAFKNIAEAAASVKATAEENTFRYGDVNEDNEVDVLDVQQVLNWVMSLQTIEDLTPRVGAAADVNKDGLLNIADVTAIINMAMGENSSQVRAAMGRRMVESNNTIYPEALSMENGVRRYAISLANSEVFANGQFDLKLAPGMTIESITVGERAKGHEVLSQDHGDFTRVAVVSMENAAIQGTDGAVVYVEVSGEGELSIDGAVFATPKAVGHVIGNGETSAIDKVIEGARDLKERIYNAAGQQLERVQRGINIIRKSDGTVTKELRK